MKVKDEIYKQKKEQLRSAISFIKAIDKNTQANQAFDIIVDASVNYAVSYYQAIFEGISLENRFDKFRAHYEQYPARVPYCEVLKSNPKILKIKFNRCPLDEVLEEENLLFYHRAFHYSDAYFTDELLPNVTFERFDGNHNGNKYYILTWTKN